MPFIKSHSNYVLKAKHQDVNDGTIYERDITTIGAVDQFTPDQTPIYRSNNFIITVRNDGRPSNQYNSTKWKENESGDIWTLQTISAMVSDFEDDNDTKIVLKQDYYDFRDFAYYGSLTELFRASVTDILARFPGELYITNEHAYYTVRENYDFDKIEYSFPLGGYGDKTDEEGNPLPKYYLISNPFNINLYAEHVPTGADPLKYFAENGFLNYQFGSGSTAMVGCDIVEEIKWCDIVDWSVTYHDPCSKLPDNCQCSDLEIEKWEPAKCKCEDLQIDPVRGGSKSATRGTLRGEDDTSSEEEQEELYRRIAEIVLSYQCKDDDGNVTDEGEIIIYAYLDDNNNVVYLVDDEELVNNNVHIRPRRSDKPHYFLDIFYNESDSFQKLLVNEDTHYKATFSVIRENEYGYYREFVPFQFPIAAGGYNLDATDYGFSEYTTQMVEIGEYYDENFTDNLWRSMTHEAIKNFDWTYTREYETGEEEEYVFGGQRIQKAIRIFAREFDEIISYINNIKNLNRVTYDERGNLPDYFLTDTVENEGWDVKLVYPYELKEYFFVEEYYFGNTKYDTKEEAIEAARQVYSNEGYKELEELIKLVNRKEECKDGASVECEDGDENCVAWTEGGNEGCDGQLNNKACGHDIVREFSQNSTAKTKPYTKNMLDPSSRDGYFMVCNCVGNSVSEDDKIPHCGYEDTDYSFVSTDCAKEYLDKCALSNKDKLDIKKGVLKDRFKTYTDETEWSYQQVNNEFLRRLKLNSRYIWRHKGTQEGIEMILGMFGMKSKRWLDAQPQWVKDCNEQLGVTYDFDVQEYVSFTSRIEETWDVIHQNYRINWINSTKSIVYDNRFISNYNKYGANRDALPYQGIPVSYREAYKSQEGDNAYLRYGEGENDYYLDENNNRIIRRYLYPNFNKDEELDGNPYYQMRGGWLAKTIVGETKKAATEGEEETPIWNFQFNPDDQIVFNKYLSKGYVEDGFVNDNKPLFKETIRNIRRVDNIASLLSIPTINLYNGIICYVTQIEKNSAVIDNVVYPISKEWYRNDVSEDEEDTGHIVSSVTFVKTDGFFKVGNSKFFDTTIILYDIDGAERIYDVEEMPDGTELKAYIVDDTFICKEDEGGNYSISNFQLLSDEQLNGYTNYFVLDDINYSNVLAMLEAVPNEDSEEEENNITWSSGWRRLSYGDEDYLKISTIVNYYEGNNPHNGRMIYDNGHDYFVYYKRLFKYAADNDLFDERCYEDYYTTLDDEIMFYGFNGLIEENEDILQYDDFLVPDSKIHYFGNYKTNTYNLRDKDGVVQATANTMFSYVNKNDEKVSGASDYVKESKYTVESKIDTVWVYGEDSYRISGTPISETEGSNGFDIIYLSETKNGETVSKPLNNNKVSAYTLSAATISDAKGSDDAKEADAKGWVEKVNPYYPLKDKKESIWNEETQQYEESDVNRYPIIDEVTNQVVNNKIFDITFKLHPVVEETEGGGDKEEKALPWYTKRMQEEIKYIDDIVMNYLTQLIPSTTILRIRYEVPDVVSSKHNND